MKVKLAIFIFLTSIATSFIQIDEGFIQTLSKKMREYKLHKPQVKVFLFFSQNIYAPGDTAYFSAHFLSEDMDPIGGRQIVRLDLMDQSGRLVFFQNIAVKDGKGFNQVAIPKVLKAGVYQWVAYSDWMKNFSPEYYFRQEFLLVEKNNLVPIKKNDEVDLKFYPEGGVFVSSILNKAVVRSNLEDGSIAKIVDQTGSKVGEVQINKNGFGYFNFTPSATDSYYAELQHLGKKVRVNLPTVSPQGFSIIMSSLQDPAKVDIRTPRESKYRNADLWLVITARSEIYFSAPVRFDDRELVTVQFPLKELPAGICYATLFSEQGEVLAERMFMCYLPEIKASITKSQITYNTRSTVDLKVSLKDPLGNPVSGEFAISVFDKRFLSNQLEGPQIDQYLYLNSEILDLSLKNGYSEEDLDLLLITQKNKRLDWSAIKEGRPELTHTFKRLIQYSGQVVNKGSGQPIPEAHLGTYLQKNLMGYEAISKQDGSFDLVFLFDFWNEDEIFYTLESKSGSGLDARVLWKTDSSSGIPLAPMIEDERVSNYADFMNRKKLVDMSYNFYSNSENLATTSQSEDLNKDFEDELTGVDYSVKVDDYVIFPTMEELIREVVPSLLHRKVKGNSVVRVVLPDGAIPKEDPLYIIDGIMTKNTSYFLQLKPAEIITIKVVRTINKLNRFGTMGRSGIVLVQTKGIDHKKLKSENTMISVKGINKPMIFRIPSHSVSSDQRIPDFRSTLYWNPSVAINSKGDGSINFSASDDVGTFLIRIQGITSDGRPFNKLDSIQLVFNKN